MTQRSKSKKELEDRVAELEDRLERYEGSKVQARLYRGLVKQVDDITSLFERIQIGEDDLRGKDDKFFERYFKFLEKIKSVTEGLNELEKKIVPKKDKKESGSVYEEAMIDDHTEL